MNITSIDTLTLELFTTAPDHISPLNERIEDSNNNRVKVASNEKLIHISCFAYLVFATIQDNAELANSFQLLTASYTRHDEKMKFLILIKDLTENKIICIQDLISNIFQQLCTSKLKIVRITSDAHPILGLKISKQTQEQYFSNEELKLVSKLFYTQKFAKLLAQDENYSIEPEIKKSYSCFAVDNINKGWRTHQVKEINKNNYTEKNRYKNSTEFNLFHLNSNSETRDFLNKTIYKLKLSPDLFLNSSKPKKNKKYL